ncbi:hypothetical protein ACOMHN_054741 [Nucella lapillus]
MSRYGIMDSVLIRLNMAWTCCFSAAGFSMASQWNKDEHQPFITDLLQDPEYLQEDVEKNTEGSEQSQDPELCYCMDFENQESSHAAGKSSRCFFQVKPSQQGVTDRVISREMCKPRVQAMVEMAKEDVEKITEGSEQSQDPELCYCVDFENQESSHDAGMSSRCFFQVKPSQQGVTDRVISTLRSGIF